MRMVFAVVLVAGVLLPQRGWADDRYGWQNSDTALEVTYAALHLMDWSQTLYVVRHQDDPESPRYLWGPESNPILGRHPTRLGVNAYMAASMAAHFTIALLLPRPYRSAWQCLTIGLESAVVGTNWSARVGFSF